MSVKKLISRLLTEPTSKIYIQIFRYLFSGGVAFVFDFGLLYLLTDILDVHYLFSATFSFSVGLVITYILNVYWVFDKRRFGNQMHELLIFVLIGVVGLLITVFFMWLFTDVAGMFYLLSKILTTIIATGWSFFMRKIVLFSKNK